MILFVPLGLLLPTLFDRCRRFLVTAFIGLLTSAGIELVQLILLLSLVSRRSVDIDDVILNVAGACLGYLIWKSATKAGIGNGSDQQSSRSDTALTVNCLPRQMEAQ